MRLVRITLVLLLVQLVAQAQPADQEIKAKTRQFTAAIVSKELSILDQVFEQDPACRCPPRHYSYRSAISGSTRVARRAGR